MRCASFTPGGFPRRAVAAGIAWCAVGRLAGAQLPGVAVDPHLVVLTSALRTSEITVFNPRATAAEYDVSLRYGYAATDSAGRPAIALGAPPADGGAGGSAAEWTTPYPRRFILQPGMWQTVRLAAAPPDSLRDGEYWARLTVHARDLAPPPALALVGADIAGVRATLSVETATVLPVLYRSGAVSTAVAIDSLTATADGDSILTRAVLRRTGSAAFLGTATVTLYDESGAVAARTEHGIAVYRDAAPRWRLPRPPTGATSYRAELVVEAVRRDIPQRLVLDAPAVRRVVVVRP